MPSALASAANDSEVFCLLVTSHVILTFFSLPAVVLVVCAVMLARVGKAGFRSVCALC